MWAARRATAGILAACSSLMMAAPARPAAAAGINAHVNFQSQTAPVPAGYVADYGQPYSDSQGFGWVAIDSQTRHFGN